MTDKLKPCPFCGNAAKVFGEDSFSFMVFCVTDKCNADQYSLTEAEAIAAWNTRAEPEFDFDGHCVSCPSCNGTSWLHFDGGSCCGNCPPNTAGQQALELLRESPLSMQPQARHDWDQRRKALLEATNHE